MMKSSNLLRPAALCAGAAALLISATSCTGRTDSNMVPDGETVKVVCDTVPPDAGAAPTPQEEA